MSQIPNHYLITTLCGHIPKSSLRPMSVEIQRMRWILPLRFCLRMLGGWKAGRELLTRSISGGGISEVSVGD